MDETLFLIILAVYFAVQLVLCLRAKRGIVKLIPVLLAVLLTVGSFVTYAVTKNWGWLIIGGLNAALLIPCGLAWAIFGIVRKLR